MSFHEHCRCGACPPSTHPRRPQTKREVLAYLRHHYGPFWDNERRLLHEAAARYVHTYSSWVNHQGWRKPMEWTEGHVRLMDLRKGPMGPEEYETLMKTAHQSIERRFSEATMAA